MDHKISEFECTQHHIFQPLFNKWGNWSSKTLPDLLIFTVHWWQRQNSNPPLPIPSFFLVSLFPVKHPSVNRVGRAPPLCQSCYRGTSLLSHPSHLLLTLTSPLSSSGPLPVLRGTWELLFLSLPEILWACQLLLLLSLRPLQVFYSWPPSLCKLICNHFICFLSLSSILLRMTDVSQIMMI